MSIPQLIRTEAKSANNGGAGTVTFTSDEACKGYVAIVLKKGASRRHLQRPAGWDLRQGTDGNSIVGNTPIVYVSNSPSPTLSFDSRTSAGADPTGVHVLLCGFDAPLHSSSVAAAPGVANEFCFFDPEEYSRPGVLLNLFTATTTSAAYAADVELYADQSTFSEIVLHNTAIGITPATMMYSLSRVETPAVEGEVPSIGLGIGSSVSFVAHASYPSVTAGVLLWNADDLKIGVKSEGTAVPLFSPAGKVAGAPGPIVRGAVRRGGATVPLI